MKNRQLWKGCRQHIDIKVAWVYQGFMANGAHLYDFKLDNAALIFPPQLHKQQTTMFRISADIDQPVNVELLNQALDHMLKRCPYYQVHLKRGLFWYYLEHCDTKARVEAESRYPCMYLPYKKPGVLPFRVLAYRNRIAFEVAHFITDGGGSLRFLNGLILEYLRLRGEKIDAEGKIIECNTPVRPEEYEDSFHKYYEKNAPNAKQVPKAFQLKGRKEKPPVYHVYQGTMDSRILKDKAKSFGATIGEFLTALLLYNIQEEALARGMKLAPIRISVPIDLHRIYPSETMRNFILTIDPEIDPRLGLFSFDDTVKRVHHFMQLEVNTKMLLRQFARNIRGQMNLFIRILPRILKDPLMLYLFNLFGRNAFTISLSNLGRIELPEDMKPFVKDYQFLPPPHKQSSLATSLAYNGNTHIFFGSTVKERSFEHRFFTSLRKMGIPVSIRTNTFNQDSRS